MQHSMFCNMRCIKCSNGTKNNSMNCTTKVIKNMKNNNKATEKLWCNSKSATTENVCNEIEKSPDLLRCNIFTEKIIFCAKPESQFFESTDRFAFKMKEKLRSSSSHFQKKYFFVQNQ